MTRIAHCLLGLVAILLSMTPNVTSAAIVTLTFDSGDYPFMGNGFENGFRISPNCWMFAGPFPYFTHPDGNVLTHGTATFCSEFSNPDYLGEPLPSGSFESVVYIDFFGHPFTLLSFQHIGIQTGISSSKGGYSVSDEDQGCDPNPTEFCQHVLDGPELTGVKWIRLEDPGIVGSTFWDNLVFRVPGGSVSAPGTLALLILGLASLGLALRRRGFTAAWGRLVAKFQLHHTGGVRPP